MNLSDTGVFALQQKEGWIKYFEAVGIFSDNATILMHITGMMDLLLAVLILVKPIRGVVLRMVFWGFLTALIRWLVGPDPFRDFVERSANWGAPLVLLFFLGWPKTFKGWFRG